MREPPYFTPRESRPQVEDRELSGRQRLVKSMQMRSAIGILIGWWRLCAALLIESVNEADRGRQATHLAKGS
jgi:hypothetical protein